MSQVIPNPKAPTDSTDYIYGERMEPYEDRMNFFLNEKVDIKKTNVKSEDSSTVDGLESIIQRFTTYGKISLPSFPENPTMELAGTESVGNKAKLILNVLIQAAKDAVEFLLNFINNRIARIDNRTYRIGVHRKREGIKQGDVNYPLTIRRLFVPLKVSRDPNWINDSLNDVLGFYKASIKAYGILNSRIGKFDTSSDLNQAIDSTVTDVASVMNMKKESGSFKTGVLPGIREFTIDSPTGVSPDDIKMYFQNSTIDVKLPSPTYNNSGVMVDKILSTVTSIIKEIRSNQSTIGQLSRNFEKAVRQYESSSVEKLSPDERAYYNWIIRFNKRLMNSTIQYVIGSLDVALDFVNSGVKR